MEHKKEHWRTWYFAVIIALVLQIALYAIFTYHYK